MKLCNKCGTLMVPQREGNRTIFVCKRCGNTARAENIAPKIRSAAKIREKIGHDLADTIPVVEDKSVKILPVTKIECPECGNGEAQWWTQQTRSSDEPETRFYRCTRCKKTWREYS